MGAILQLRAARSRDTIARVTLPSRHDMNQVVLLARHAEDRALDALDERGGLAAVTPPEARRADGWERAALLAWMSSGEWSPAWEAEALVPDGWSPSPWATPERAAYATGGHLVKVARHAYGREANLCEARLWARAAPEVAAQLAPVLAASADGSWLVMPRVGASAPAPDPTPPALRAVFGDAVARPGRWGLVGGRVAVVEYGDVPRDDAPPGRSSLLRFLSG